MKQFITLLSHRHYLNKLVFFGAILVLCIVGYSLRTSSAHAACAAPTASFGSTTSTVTVATTGTYRVWTRLKVPDTTHTSYQLQIDNSANCYTVGGSSAISANSWTWVDYQDGNSASKINVSLTAGTHTLTSIGTSAGVGIDRVIFTTDTGAGDSCNPPVSNGATCVTPPASDTTAPSIPAGLQAAGISSSQITLSWTASTDTGGSGLKGYNVYRNGTQVNTAPITATSYTDSGLTAGTSYSYTVKAFDGAVPANVSAASTALPVTTTSSAVDNPPTWPATTKISIPEINYYALLGACSPSSSCYQTVSWTLANDDHGITGYDVLRSVGTAQPVLIGSTVGSTTHSFKDAKIYGNVTYVYQIVAKDGLHSTPGPIIKKTITCASIFCTNTIN